MSVYMKGNSDCVENNRPTCISLANNVVIVLDHLSYNFKFKLNSCQHYSLNPYLLLPTLYHSYPTYNYQNVQNAKYRPHIMMKATPLTQFPTHFSPPPPPLPKHTTAATQPRPPQCWGRRLQAYLMNRGPAGIGTHSFHKCSMPAGCVTNRSSSNWR
jgi:hypothetical protein